MPAANVLSEFEYLLSKANELHFYDSGKKLEGSTRFKQYLTPLKAKGSDFRSVTTVGLGQHVIKKELTSVAFDAYEKGTERTTKWSTFGLAWRASAELIEDAEDNGRIKDDQANIFKDVNFQMRRSADVTMETIAADMILKAASTVETVTWTGAGRDGKALAATNHTTKKAPIKTFSNYQGNISLSSVALQEAYFMLSNQPTQEGFPSAAPTSMTLVIGPYWEFRMEEIMGTRKQLDSTNNNSDPLNKIKDRLKVVVNEYLGYDFKGWMLINNDVARLHYALRRKPTFSTDRDFQSDGLLFKSTFRFGIDHLSYYGTVFCAGPA